MLDHKSSSHTKYPKTKLRKNVFVIKDVFYLGLFLGLLFQLYKQVRFQYLFC